MIARTIGSVPLPPDVAREQAWNALVELMPSYGFDNVSPLVPLGQADHETGGFTSNLATRYNNVFGMKYPRQRQTTAVDSVTLPDGDFAVYLTLRDSIEDYLIRQRGYNVPNTSDAIKYIDATIATGYAMDPSYRPKWIAAVERMMDEPFAVGEGVAIFDDEPDPVDPQSGAPDDRMGLGMSFLFLLMVVGIGREISRSSR